MVENLVGGKMFSRKILYRVFCAVELLLILFCCVWLSSEVVYNLKLVLSVKDEESIFQSICLTNGKVLRVAVLDDSFSWPAMRRNLFDMKCVVISDDGKRYVRIVATSSKFLVVPLLRRIVDVGNVQDIDEFLEMSIFETQTMVVISWFLMSQVYILLIVIIFVITLTYIRQLDKRQEALRPIDAA